MDFLTQGKGIGLIVVISFIILIFAIVTNACADWSPLMNREGFQAQMNMPKGGKEGPAPVGKLTSGLEPKELVDVGLLPGAPVNGLAEANSLPFQDPALMKADLATLNELKKDMDSFASFEQPHLDKKSDPAVTMPLTRFKGDYQRIKDEVLTLSRNPGLQSQLTMDDVDGMAANLRFLQRTYRLYAATKEVPPVRVEITKVGVKEGFQVGPDGLLEGFADPTKTPITPDQLNMLSQRLAVEIVRLQASATNDPVVQSRVNILTKMRQKVDDINAKVKAGSLPVAQIPIMQSDYEKFLPVLGSSSGAVSKLLSGSGNTGLASLFDSYDKGDVSGSLLAGALFEKYADDLIKGTSVQLSYTYTSQNQKDVEQAKAQQVDGVRAVLMNAPHLFGLDGHPGTTKGSRGEFESYVREADLAGFAGQKGKGGEGYTDSYRMAPLPASTAGGFDWKQRVDDIMMNMKRVGLDAAEFGGLAPGASVSSDYSWRGHCKMMCSRLRTMADPGQAEQMGCPPESWKGWRS